MLSPVHCGFPARSTSVSRLRRFGILGAMAVLAITRGAIASPAPGEVWQIGLAKTKITPTEPVVMGGFASRRDPFVGVIHDVWVKTMAIEDHTGHRAVLITCDFIGFRAVNADPICAAIMERTGLGRDQILLNCSHTHTGPSQADSPTTDSYLPAPKVRDLYDYTEWLKTQVVDTAVAALENLAPATLGHGIGVAPFVMNRREPSPRGIVLGHNPSGPADRSVPVLKITDLDGEVRGVLFGAACHNTTILPTDNQVCGDFAGYAQIWLEETYPGAQAMFMQGCGGDAGPYPTGKLEYSRAHGQTLGAEVQRLIEQDAFHSVRGALRTGFTKVELPLRGAMTPAEIAELQRGPAQWKRWVGQKMAARLENGDPWPESHPAPLAVWQFGDDLTLVGLSGEVVVDYVARIEEAVGPLNLWIAGYCNDVFGYLPSARVLREGGYETRGLYSGELFSPRVEDVVVNEVRALAESVGRSVPELN
ncbi:neutral/alkaline non-lysosomal ceramidase N-terminal domain-containing protein [Synoicihabitans lomoniglobus]|uniref:Neutral/alkaline non-lysosomal ceramidase N-terminal domain-containing protein n=1 Tax=Synoicihabitans lomoniglobus TaxID=2909285 RepID=A0AAE9ZRT2_9BACT|nr:hypothetical protein [Opitutaceae bacterium LMO-M01]WED64065.1 hypothetical protein PXH66_17140 [Opitutaceae bacterium LMO-M01]